MVGDSKYDDLRKEDAPTAYIPLKNGEVTFALRSAAAPGALIPVIRRIVSEVDDNLPVFRVRTQSQTIDRCFSTSASLRDFLLCSDSWR